MKISINAGHTKTGAGYGIVSKGFKESVIVRAVAKALTAKLRERGHTVYDSTVDKATTRNAYIKKVCQLADESDAELFISIHCNASATHLGRGVECYTWKGAKLSQAYKICENITALGFKNRGVKDGSKFYVVKHMKERAILVEIFFIDNQNDRNLYLEHGPERLAEAIAASL